MPTRTIPAAQVADEIRRRLPGVGELKLQKLLYKCQGHHLAWYDEPMFSDTISAWDMGPVVPNVWRADKEQPPSIDERWPALGERVLNTIGYVISRYGEMSGTNLMNLTHSETPWIRANAHRLPVRRSAKIRTEWIKDYHVAADLAEQEDQPQVDPDEVKALLNAAAAERPSRPLQPDSLDDIRAWARRG
jgi:uncharacterized phage-associated protein